MKAKINLTKQEAESKLKEIMDIAFGAETEVIIDVVESKGEVKQNVKPMPYFKVGQPVYDCQQRRVVQIAKIQPDNDDFTVTKAVNYVNQNIEGVSKHNIYNGDKYFVSIYALIPVSDALKPSNPLWIESSMQRWCNIFQSFPDKIKAIVYLRRICDIGLADAKKFVENALDWDKI